MSKKNENQHVKTRETRLTPEGDWKNQRKTTPDASKRTRQSSPPEGGQSVEMNRNPTY